MVVDDVYPTQQPGILLSAVVLSVFVNWRLSWWVPVAGGGEGGAAAPRHITVAELAGSFPPCLFLLPLPSCPFFVVMTCFFLLCSQPRRCALAHVHANYLTIPPPSIYSFITYNTHGQEGEGGKQEAAAPGKAGKETGATLSRLHRLLHDHQPHQQQYEQQQYRQPRQQQGEDEEAAKARERQELDDNTLLPFLLLPPSPSSRPPHFNDEDEEEDTTPTPAAAAAAALKTRKMNSEKLANYAPTHFKFSPDDAYLTYLHAASHQVRQGGREEGGEGGNG